MDKQVKEEKPMIIDLEEYKTVTELSEEWSKSVTDYFKFFFAEDTERNLSALMKWYIQNLKDEALDQIDDKVMRNAIERHILFLKLYFKEMDCGFYENYLQHMEDILAIYCHARIKTLPKKRCRNAPVFKDELFNICQRLVSLLRTYLLGQEHCVIHVLLKMRMNIETEEARDFFNVIFSYFVKAPPSSKSDLTFCRIYILCQRWKNVKPRSEWDKMDEQLYVAYGHTPESLESSETLRKILLPRHNSVIQILARVNADCQDLIKNYFDFVHATDANDMDQMQNLGIYGNDDEIVPDFVMEEDEDFLKIYHQHIESMANATNVTYVGETIDLSDDEVNSVKGDPDSDVEYLPTNQECIEILSDSDDEIVFEPVEPAYVRRPNMTIPSNPQESEVCHEIATSSQEEAQNTNKTAQAPNVSNNDQNEQRPTRDISVQTEECNRRISDLYLKNWMADCNIELPSNVRTSNSETENNEPSQNSTENRPNSPEELIVEMPVTISASPQQSPNSTQHPSSSSHIENKSHSDSYVSPTSPDISSTLFDEDDSIHGRTASNNTSNNIANIAEDSTSNENKVTQSNIENVSTPERECYSPEDKNYLQQNGYDDHVDKNKQDDVSVNGKSAPNAEGSSSDHSEDDTVPDIRSEKCLKVSVPKLNLQKVAEKKQNDKIMFTSSCNINRTSFNNCQFEEFFNNQSQFCEDILSGPLAKTNGTTCSNLLIDKSFDLFDNDKVINNNVNSPSDTSIATPNSNGSLLPPFEEALDDFYTVNPDIHNSSKESKQEENQSQLIKISKVLQPNNDISPVTMPTESPIMPTKRTKVRFNDGSNYANYRQHPSRPQINSTMQPKSILKTKKLRIEKCRMNLDSLAYYGISPYDTLLQNEVVVNVRELPKFLTNFSVASLMERLGSVGRLGTEKEPVQSVIVKKMYDKKLPLSNINNWRSSPSLFQDSMRIEAIKGCYKSSPNSHAKFGTGKHESFNGVTKVGHFMKRTKDSDADSLGHPRKKRKGGSKEKKHNK